MRLKKHFIAGVMLALVAFYFLKPGQTPQLNVEEINQALSWLGPPQGFAAYLRRPLIALPHYLAASSLTQECQTYVKRMEQVDPDVKDGLKVAHLPVPGPDCNIEDEAVAESEKGYIKACHTKNLSKDEVVDQECINSMVLFRSSLTNFLTQKRTSISDPQTLARIVYFLWTERTKKNAHLQNRLVWATEALEKVDSKQTISRKILIQIQANHLIENGGRLSREKREQEWKVLEDQVGDSFSDFAIWIKTRGFDEHRMERLAGELLSKNPSSPQGLLLSAFSHWKQNEFTESFEVLKKAAAGEKEGGEFTSLLSSLSQKGVGQEAFLKMYDLELTQADFEK